ncbi:uncharacterized protein LOC120071984 [Benincasa hispida]|uniref:uncharacterized protein LOC120071984 n=1 Tax=Benincasa hispida TaxID=102211 RepID=UPI0019004ACB|nr:uncharacterized protein LOC120071984 [Benincasa hispida]
MGNHQKAKSRVIGHLIKSKYEQVGQTYLPRDIIEDARGDFGVNISYERVYRAREYRLVFARGSQKGSYIIVKAYDEIFKLANPGVIFEVEVEDEQYFKYVFIAFGLCIRGFLNCICLVAVVDETHLYEKYKGMLLIATCIDGNNNIYPIAFNIVVYMNDASWTWFMTHLKASVRDILNLVIISYHHISIEKVVSNIFSNAFHALCIYHIQNNLMDRFKNKDIIPHFYLAAKAYKMSEFQMSWAKLYQYPG